MQKLDERFAPIDAKLALILDALSDRGQRLTAVERALVTAMERMDGTNRRLDRIERRLGISEI
jgi:hypothetical protein